MIIAPLIESTFQSENTIKKVNSLKPPSLFFKLNAANKPSIIPIVTFNPE